MGEFVCIKRKYYLNCSDFISFRNSLEFYRSVNISGLVKRNLTLLSFPVFKLFKEKIEKNELFKGVGCEAALDFEPRFGAFSGVYVPLGSGKIVVQISDRSGQIKGYLKVAYSNKGKMNLENEVNILGFLKSNNVLDFAYPEVLDKIEADGLLLVYLSSYKELRRPFKMPLKDVVALAERIFSVEKRTVRVEESEFINDICRRIEKSSYREILKDVFERVLVRLKGVEIETGLVHGDFKIWNVFFLPDGRPYIIDWEWSRRFGFPMWDVWTWVVLGDLSRGRIFPKNFASYKVNGEESLLFGLFLVSLTILLEEAGHKDSLTYDSLRIILRKLEKY